GRPIEFETWLDDLQLYLLSDSTNSVSLFDHTSGAAPAPPATADSATRSQWLTHDAATRLAIRNHLPLAECAHFAQHRTAQALDHFLSLDPTVLTVDLIEQNLLAAETSVFAVGAPRGTPRTPFFEGCSPSPLPPPTPVLLLLTSLVLQNSGLLLLVLSAAPARARVVGVVAVAAGVVVGAAEEVVEAVEVVAVVGVVAGVGALVEAVVAAVGVAVLAAVGVVAVGLELLSVEVREVAKGSTNSVGARPRRPSRFVTGLLSVGRLG
ncbi:unnamed protein product, partial [Closterium sp. NIES-54]